MESHAINRTFSKSRNIIWRTISSRDHESRLSPVMEKKQPQSSVVDNLNDVPGDGPPQFVLDPTLSQTNDEHVLDSNIINEIVSPRQEGNTQVLEFEEPKIGMDFPTEELAYNFYNIYAFHVGFSIRRNLIRKNNAGVVTMRTFTCSKEGFYREKSNCEQPKKEHLDIRTGCNAHMRINLSEKGVYTVKSFESEHNHCVATPSKRKLLRSQREMNEGQKANADIADSAGLKPKQTYDLLAKQAGGRKHLCFLPVDYKNYLRSKRMHAMAMGDAGALMQYLQKRVKDDPSFYYAVQLDEDDQIANIFWADGRSLLDYDCFGDVVCFDTTYKTNGYGRPFAPFLGVNHHKQTLVFGGALLYDEKVESFEWLFQTFMHAVGGKAPGVILTDQDAAMNKAIEIVWPNTTHRLCVWYMYQNAAKHLSHVFSGSKTFEKDFSYCVYDCEDEEEFFEAWNSMVEKYNLYENEWLNELFKNRIKWALVYGRQVFCADMKSTQRSESINSVIKRYLDPRQCLLDFFNHYERLLEERRHAELIADFYASQGTPRVEFSDMLKQAASILTPNVFKVFRIEYGRFLDCSIYDSGTTGVLRTYTVIDGGNGRRKKHTVQCDLTNNNITCSCLKFEFVGVQCCHVMKVLDTMNIKQLPDKYYLKRWCKDAKAGRIVPLEGVDELDPKVDMANRYSSLMRTYSSLISRASQSQRAYSYALESAKDLMSNIEANLSEEMAQNVNLAVHGKEHKVSPPAATSNVLPEGPKGITKLNGGRGRKRIKGVLESNSKNHEKINDSVKGATTKQRLPRSRKDKNVELGSVGSTISPSPFCFPSPLVYSSASQLLNAMHVLSSSNTSPGIGIGQGTIPGGDIPMTNTEMEK